ncbi:MAG TPA: VOC family protein [Chloroflexota bacterium]|nr:VOC family protein [Chloroflexota bacterium]
MRAHISYIAMLSDQPDKLADYYATFFGLRELGRSAGGDISVTDGFYNLTILKRRAELGEENDAVGLHHFGLAIDDIHAFEGQLEEFAPQADIRAESGDVHHGEYRLIDTSGLTVSLSTKHFNTPAQRHGNPSIRHLALKVPDNDVALRFYDNVIGLQETESSRRRRAAGSSARFAGDGSTAWAIFPETGGEENEGGVNKLGVNHFGFVIPNLDEMLGKLPPEGRTSKRPANRPFAEWRTFDPDGNGIDISEQLGYEVDPDVWVRA